MVTAFLVIYGLKGVSLVTLFLMCIFRTVVFPAVFTVSLGKLNKGAGQTSSFLVVSPMKKTINPILVNCITSGDAVSLSFVVPFISFYVILFCS